MKSFHYALRGIARTYHEERNFRIECFFALLAIVFSFLFSLSWMELSLIIVVCALVLSLEVFNSAMERYLDVVEARMKSYVQIIKDMLAGAVFIASFGAFLIGLIIFLPYFSLFLRNYLF